MFKHPRKMGMISVIIMGAGLFMAVTSGLMRIVYLDVAGVIVLLLGLLFRFIFYRCPHCKLYLGRGFDKKCRNCGADIED